MRARVKEDGRLNVVTAFGGREYTKREWRPVPEGFEAAAEAHPLLVTADELQVAIGEAPVEPEVADESGRTDLQRSGGRKQRQRDS
jgi:hypothetical protein